MDGYIYVRQHSAYGENCKVGSTINIPERDTQYATGEVFRGKFTLVISCASCKLIERLIQSEFKALHVKYDGGNEFYKRDIIALIAPFMASLGVSHKVLNETEISLLLRRNRVREIIKKINLKEMAAAIRALPRYRPRDYQLEIIECAVNYFQLHTEGTLALICGIGKTLISLWVAQRLGARKILVGVPSVRLLSQWAEVINEVFRKPAAIIYDNPRSTESDIIITTYASAHKLKGAMFDIVILDESHHVTYDLLLNSNILAIKCRRRLSLTATPKGDKNIITERNLSWAIDRKIVCDYLVQAVVAYEKDELILSASAAVASIQSGNTHHIIVYANTTENARYIAAHISKFDSSIYCYAYLGENPESDKLHSLEQFEKSARGILICVYCLGEGWDIPLLDGVVFAENMTSDIRIVQSAFRANRKNKNEPDKIMKIILPSQRNDYRKLKEVLRQIEGDSVISKVCAYSLSVGAESGAKMSFIDDRELTSEIKLRNRLFTYEQAKRVMGHSIHNRTTYYELCARDDRFPKNPEDYFGDKFAGWIDYLSIKGDFYDTTEFHAKFGKMRALDLDEVVAENPKLPPAELWEEFYGAKRLSKKKVGKF